MIEEGAEMSKKRGPKGPSKYKNGAKTIAVYLPLGLYEYAKRTSKERGMSLSAFIAALLRKEWEEG